MKSESEVWHIHELRCIDLVVAYRFLGLEIRIKS